MYSTARSRIKHAISRTASIGIVVIVIIIIVIGAYAALTLGATTTTTTTTSTTVPTTSSTSSSSVVTSSSTHPTTSTTSSSVTSTTSTTSSAPPTAIRIGILEPLTGFASEYGLTETLAAQFAASEINSAGGINGMQIEIFSADEGSGGTQTINAFNELVLQDHVNFIIGTDFSGDLLAILPLIVKYHVVTMSLSNSLDKLHNLIGTNNATSYNMYKYYFTLVYNDTYAGVSMVDNYAVPLHASSIFITGEDYLYAHEVGAGAAAEAQAKGISVAGQQTYFPGDQLDFSSEVLNIVSLNPSVIILVASGSDSETFVKALKQNPQTSNIPLINICCGDLTDPSIVANLRASGTNLNYVAQQGWYYPMNFSSQTPVFVQNWRSKFGTYPNLYTEGTSYDAIHIFAQAVNTTGGLNSDALASAIENMTYHGITGVIKFNSQNAVSFPPYIMPEYEFTNQTMQIFWPPSVANGTYVPPPGYTWTPPSS